MAKAILPDPGVRDELGSANKPWYKGWFLNLYMGGKPVLTAPIDATIIQSGLLDPQRIANLLGQTIIFGTGRTLADVSADAALGALDPVGRINTGSSLINGTKIADGTLSPQAIDTAVAMTIAVILGTGGAIQTDDYVPATTGLKIGNGVFDVNLGIFRGTMSGIINIGHMLSDLVGNLFFGDLAMTPEKTHGILADGREFWGSQSWDDAPTQMDNNGDFYLSDSPQSRNFIDLGAIAPYCKAVMPSSGGGQFDGDLFLTPLTRNAAIWYTSDGSDPTVLTNGARTLYLGPIPIHPGPGQTIIIRAYAIKLGVESVVSRWDYTGDPNTCAAPTATPIPGPYFNKTATLDVTLMVATPGATIIVTTDGTEPSDFNGFAYVAPIHLTNGRKTIKAFAKAAGLIPSGVSVFNYEVRKGTNSGTGEPGGGGGTGGGGGHGGHSTE